VCGPPSTELAAAIELTWDAVAGPRSRVQCASGEQIPDPLRRAVAQLQDVPAHRADAGRTRPDAGGDTGDGEMDHAGMEGDDPPGDMDHADKGHGDMDHGGMSMEMDLPGGLAMADRAPDRDGLRLDVLHLQLGPFCRPGRPAWSSM